MSAEYIRDTYAVPARAGVRVMTSHGLGTIVGFYGHYLRVRLEASNQTGVFHPTWEITYLDETPAA